MQTTSSIWKLQETSIHQIVVLEVMNCFFYPLIPHLKIIATFLCCFHKLLKLLKILLSS